MSEWFKEHAWKSDLFTRAEPHRILPTHSRPTTSVNIDTRRHVLVNHCVDRGFRGLCDTVPTQSRSPFTPTHTDAVVKYDERAAPVQPSAVWGCRPRQGLGVYGVMDLDRVVSGTREIAGRREPWARCVHFTEHARAHSALTESLRAPPREELLAMTNPSRRSTLS